MDSVFPVIFHLTLMLWMESVIFAVQYLTNTGILLISDARLAASDVKNVLVKQTVLNAFRDKIIF